MEVLGRDTFWDALVQHSEWPTGRTVAILDIEIRPVKARSQESSCPNVWGDERPSGSTASEAPARLCVTFCGNGFHSKEWWARGEGEKMDLGRVLKPLADFRTKLLFLQGLYHEEARKGNIHSSQTGNMPSPSLHGAPPLTLH